DRFGFLFSIFETKRRAATNDLEVFDLAQSCDQFFRQSIGKIFVSRITAFVKQWQYRDRFLRNLCDRFSVRRAGAFSSRVTAEEEQRYRDHCAEDSYVDPRATE